MKTRASPAQMEMAAELLVLEGSEAMGATWPIVASRVRAKLLAHLGPILGVGGVLALLVRSAELSADEFSFLTREAMSDEGGVLAGFAAQDPDVAERAAKALFGMFLALTTGFIGERLTFQVLRSAWPTLRPTASTETNQ